MENYLEQRTRNIAHRIWEEEGRPAGQEGRHWRMAVFVVGQEDAERAGLLPRPPKPAGEDETGQAESSHRDRPRLWNWRGRLTLTHSRREEGSR